MTEAQTKWELVTDLRLYLSRILVEKLHNKVEINTELHLEILELAVKDVRSRIPHLHKLDKEKHETGL